MQCSPLHWVGQRRFATSDEHAFVKNVQLKRSSNRGSAVESPERLTCAKNRTTKPIAPVRLCGTFSPPKKNANQGSSTWWERMKSSREVNACGVCTSTEERGWRFKAAALNSLSIYISGRTVQYALINIAWCTPEIKSARQGLGGEKNVGEPTRWLLMSPSHETFLNCFFRFSKRSTRWTPQPSE